MRWGNRWPDTLARLTEAGAAGLWGRSLAVLRQGGPRALLHKAHAAWHAARLQPVPGEPRRDRRDYGEWVLRYDTLTGARRRALIEELAALATKPKISVLMPTYNPRREWLAEAIASVQAQIYPHWELCIADDASPEPHVREVLEEFVGRDPRIRVAYRKVNGHISATSNTALALATGEWVALLDHDDLLPPDALLQVAIAINASPQARLIYSDEDKYGPQGRFGPYFKSEWNPDLFLGQNMFSHLGVLQTELVRRVGGFREGLEGSQDYDLVLRCIEQVHPEQVVHVPRVLYHWRVHRESTAHSVQAKPYAQVAAVRALKEHFARQGVGAEVVATGAGYRVVHPLPPVAPRVAVVVQNTRELSTRRLRRRIDALLSATRYPSFRIILSGGESAGPTKPDCIAARSPADLLAAIGPAFEIVCTFDIGMEPADGDWLEELVRQVCRPGVGMAAPLLIGPGQRVASAGVVLQAADHMNFRGMDAYAGLPLSSPGHGGRAQLVQRYSAVRDLCVAMRASLFRDVVQEGLSCAGDGGLRLSAFMREKGLAVIWTPFSRLRVDRNLLARRPLGSVQWPNVRDPAYSPNLFAGAADFTFAWPPSHIEPQYED